MTKYQNSAKIESKNESMISEYLGLVRSKAIEEIKKAKYENSERYEMNKNKYKYK